LYVYHPKFENKLVKIIKEKLKSKNKKKRNTIIYLINEYFTKMNSSKRNGTTNRKKWVKFNTFENNFYNNYFMLGSDLNKIKPT